MLQTVRRIQTKMRLAITGGEASGKTVSALLAAYGITDNWQKVALIDTTNNSASFHSYLGRFNTLQLGAPYTSEKLQRAIHLCEEACMDAIVIDNLSDAWNGEGGIVDTYSSLPGTDAERYREAMAQHYALMESIRDSSCHIICTMHHNEQKIVQEQNISHHFITMVKLDTACRAHVIKDRTGLLHSVEPSAITPEIGKDIGRWCEAGENPVSSELHAQIDNCQTMEELVNLMLDQEVKDMDTVHCFTQRRRELERGEAAYGKGLTIAHANL